MREDFVEYYKYFVERFGIESQRLMCIEEMSELTKELCKLERCNSPEKEAVVIEHIQEELADVLNMAEQLEYYYGKDIIEQIRKEKIDRELKRQGIK